ncbi:MAG: hypothetical protein ACJAYZ_000894, partial [Bacteroidia bacterium]
EGEVIVALVKTSLVLASKILPFTLPLCAKALTERSNKKLKMNDFTIDII